MEAYLTSISEVVKDINLQKSGKTAFLQTLHYSTGFDIPWKVWKISAKETQENHIKVLKKMYISGHL